MQISGVVHTEAVPALHDRASEAPDVAELRARLDDVGVTLAATHPGSREPSLAPFFTVDIPDDAELLGRVLEILHESSVVEAAYVKPADEPP